MLFTPPGCSASPPPRTDGTPIGAPCPPHGTSDPSPQAEHWELHVTHEDHWDPPPKSLWRPKEPQDLKVEPLNFFYKETPPPTPPPVHKEVPAGSNKWGEPPTLGSIP